MTTITFKDIYIGTPDGETEAQNEKFEELFYDSNNKYEELMSRNEKFLVIGSKGSGKTYLAHYVCRKATSKQKRKIIDSKTFWQDKLTNINGMVLDNELTFALCKWFVLDKLGRLIVENLSFVQQHNIFSKKNKLNRFINSFDNDSLFKAIKSISNNSLSKENGISGRFSTGGSLNYISSEYACTSNSVKNKSKSLTVEYSRKEFYELIGTYEKKIKNAITEVDDITLIFDDLDELDKRKPVTELIENDVILNLIKIVKSYNIDFNLLKKKVKLILLIRTDVLNELQMYDTNLSKIKTSCGVELYWITSTSSGENHPLMSMVLHKIKASCPAVKNVSKKELYNRLFPDKINGKRPLEYLLDFSFGRPRDIVTYLNHVIKEFPENTCFTAKSLKEVRKLYSSDFYDELLNESYFHENPQYTKECLQLISGLKRTSFTYDLLFDYYSQYAERYTLILDLEKAVKFLYKMGVIGNVWKVENDSKTHSSWSYRKDAMDEVDFSKKFTIHYALRKKFSI